MTTPHRPPAPASGGLHYSFEKAGLTLERQPIPWNAEAVLVEAVVRMPPSSPEAWKDFTLHLPGGPTLKPESSRPGDAGQTHVFFRLAVPPRTLPAELRWRDRSRGQINLPVLTRDEFLAGIKAIEPTVHVRLRNDVHACGAYVTSQAKELIASTLLTSATSLAPLADLELAAAIVQGDRVLARRVIRLESNQLASRQASIVVAFARPKSVKVRDWTIAWTLGESLLASRAVHGSRIGEFQNSLRVSTTRLFLVDEARALPLARSAPSSWVGIRRVGPVFLVASGIPGMAGEAEFAVHGLDASQTSVFTFPPTYALVTDAPTVIAPGTVSRDPGLTAFQLRCGRRVLGSLSLEPLPTSLFTAEGGIANAEIDFAWSPEAEDQLQQRLGSLLGGF